MNTHTQPERLRCEVCDMPTLGDTLCNYHYDEREKNMSTTYTKGPWKMLDLGEQRGDDSPIVVHAEQQEVDIAVMANDCELRSEIKANARLIAASPDLLEALKAVTENAYPISYGFKINGPTLKKVQAAIAKAEGKAS